MAQQQERNRAMGSSHWQTWCGTQARLPNSHGCPVAAIEMRQAASFIFNQSIMR